jgi:hypothetical protein
MTGRTTAKRLFDLEIDEVSLVDRPANQHGLVAIAKRDEGEPMAFYDGDGYEVTEDEIEIGETVYDDAGNEYLMADADELDDSGEGFDEGELDGDFADEFDGELVGKAGSSVEPYFQHSGSARGGGNGGRSYGRRGPSRTRRAPGGARERMMGEARSARARGSRYAGQASRALGPRGRAAAAGGAALGGGFAVGRRSNASKSLGDAVLQELSKAINDGDRDEVIAKMGDMVQEARDSAREAWNFAKGLAEERDLDAYTQLAQSYEHLPVPAEQLGPVLKSAAAALPPQQLAVLDRVLSAGPVDYDELGYGGRAESDVMTEINALANETIAKGAVDLSQAEVVVGLFDANPDLYDAYNAESGQR